MYVYSRINTFPLQDIDDGLCGWAHEAVVYGEYVETHTRCGLTHKEFMEWWDCPVASNWTLLRTPTP